MPIIQKMFIVCLAAVVHGVELEPHRRSSDSNETWPAGPGAAPAAPAGEKPRGTIGVVGGSISAGTGIAARSRNVALKYHLYTGSGPKRLGSLLNVQVLNRAVPATSVLMASFCLDELLPEEVGFLSSRKLPTSSRTRMKLPTTAVRLLLSPWPHAGLPS